MGAWLKQELASSVHQDSMSVYSLCKSVLEIAITRVLPWSYTNVNPNRNLNPNPSPIPNPNPDPNHNPNPNSLSLTTES